MSEAGEVSDSAIDDLVEGWCTSEYQIHKRPPFKAHSFDRNDEFWVVGTTHVSVLHGWHGSESQASYIADALNNTPAAIRYLNGFDHS